MNIVFHWISPSQVDHSMDRQSEFRYKFESNLLQNTAQLRATPAAYLEMDTMLL